MAAQTNFHASALVIGDRGVLVAGPSGSGKTALCLALIDRCAAAGVFASLVSDDQVLLEAAAGGLIARAPGAIAGLVEVRGFRPSPIGNQRSVVADLLVRLVPAKDAPRYSEGGTAVLEGRRIACLELPARSARRNVWPVWAWLQRPPFAPRGEPTSAP